jgi:hypothetical protein
VNEEDVGGPYLQAAVFCENVIEGKDGVLSLIRIIDRTIVRTAGTEAPEKMPPTTINARLVLMFKSGFAKGSFPVKIRPQGPDGRRLPDVTVQIHLEGDDRGTNVVLQIGMLVEEEGLYWFDVFLQDKLMTRMPFRLVYQRTAFGG